MCKELSNFGLQDAKTASSANCFALRDGAKRIAENSASKKQAALKFFTLPSLPQTLPKHIPSLCYLWMHRRSSKWELETMRGCRELRCFVQQQFHCWCMCPPREQSSVVLHQHLSIANRWCSHRSSSLNLAPRCKWSWPQLNQQRHQW